MFLIKLFVKKQVIYTWRTNIAVLTGSVYLHPSCCSFCLLGWIPVKPDWWLHGPQPDCVLDLILRSKSPLQLQHSLSASSGLGPEQRLHLSRTRTRALWQPGTSEEPRGWRNTETLRRTRLDCNSNQNNTIIGTDILTFYTFKIRFCLFMSVVSVLQ